MNISIRIPIGEKCYKCEKKAGIRELYKGNWTGKYICRVCYQINYRKEVRGQLAGCRTGNLDPNSNKAKGNNFQLLTCKWLQIDDLNFINDDHNCSIDHSRHHKLGIIQTKGKSFDTKNKVWMFGKIERDWYKEFDNYVFYCASKNGKEIDIIIIIPKEEIIKRTTIAIYKEGHHWYEQYRVKDEDVNNVNEIWKDIIKV